ncbi:MAG TPA: DUF819 family protein [Bacteroidales bacterium]|nr:DUF819 family protein [Bacteroidales bacterium]
MKLLLISIIYLLGPVAIILFFNYVKPMRKLGTILMAYGVGVLMSVINLTPTGPDEKASIASLQEWIMNIAVPIAIPLMLLSSDFTLWRKSLKKTLSALIGGIVAVVLAVFLAFLIFDNQGVKDLWKAAGMMIGMFTGGTMNFVAVGQSLHTDPTTFTLFSTFEMLLSFFFLLFVVGGGYRIFRWILPYQDASITKEVAIDQTEFNFEDYKGMLKPRLFWKMMLGFLLSVGFVIVGAGLSLALTGKLNELVIIFTITALAIGFSFIKSIRKLPKTFELGMFFIIMFSIVIASQFNIQSLSLVNLSIIGFIAFVIVVATLLHLLFSRVFKVPGDLFTVAHVALLYSPPFVPPVAGAMHNKKVLISGIVIGLIGYAIGTYLGVGVAEIIKNISSN